MAEYTGWKIEFARLTAEEIKDGAQSAEAVRGLDLDASCNRFNEVLAERLASAFPGATIEAADGCRVYGPDGGYTDTTEQYGTLDYVAMRLLCHEAGAWMVEVANT